MHAETWKARLCLTMENFKDNGKYKAIVVTSENNKQYEESLGLLFKSIIWCNPLLLLTCFRLALVIFIEYLQ